VKHFQDKAALIWANAELMRGVYKPFEYGRVVLPMTVLRRLECVLEPTKPAVLAKAQDVSLQSLQSIDPVLERVAGQRFYNRSPLDLRRLLSDPDHVADNLRSYLDGFSTTVREAFERFGFEAHIQRLDENDLLFQIVAKFAATDLHPERVPNETMGYVFEELIRRFSEESNESPGEHFTPREVVRLMVDLLFIGDDALLRDRAIIRTLYDPACGTGGMLSVAQERLEELNPDATLALYGQELNVESHAICQFDMMIKGQDARNIVLGNSFSRDGHARESYDYFLSNPPYGVEWKQVQAKINDEYSTLGWDGRFGAGLPRIDDGSLLFLQHLIAKWKEPQAGGSRLGIVFNGSPLYIGDAGSGESNIRRWIIEHDWLEAIVALPDQLFYNTPISTYVWILTNRKPMERQGTVQLVNATGIFRKMRKSLGNKRHEIAPEGIDEIVRLYGDYMEEKRVKVFHNEDFGFRKITVERPLRIRYNVTDEGIERALASRPILAKLALDDGTKREALIEIMRDAAAQGPRDEKAVTKALESALLSRQIALSGPAKKALIDGLTVRDESAPPVTKNGKPVADPALRDTENVSLTEDIDEYMVREVLPYVPDAWVDGTKTKIGYEIPFTRHFYEYVPPRPLEEIDVEIKQLEADILELLREVVA
jgi:type I restriction enzyme M protein